MVTTRKLEGDKRPPAKIAELFSNGSSKMQRQTKAI